MTVSVPPGVTTCTVTYGKALGPLFSEATRIEATLTIDRKIVHTATGWSINQIAEKVTPAGPGGEISFEAAHVDQDGFHDASGATVKNWYYTLSGNIVFDAGRQISFTKRFQVLVGQTNIDLDNIADGPAIPGVTAPSASVIAVAGYSGSVTVEQLAAALGIDDLPTTLTTLQSEIDARETPAGAQAKADAAEADAKAASIPLTQKGANSGVGTLDSSGKQPESQVPDRLTAAQLNASFASVVRSDTGAPLSAGHVKITVDPTTHEIIDIIWEA